MSATKLLRRAVGATTDAITLLHKDHETVKKLFDRFEKAEEKEDDEQAKKLALEAIAELKVHAQIEEEIFYPALRRQMEDEDGLLDEADEEHHAAKLLISELGLMSGDEENYCAKFTVLAENVRHHIKEEETQLFKQARRTDVDFEALGERMSARKDELKSGGVPQSVEERMIRQAGLPKASPAKLAMQDILVPLSDRKHSRRRSRLRALTLALAVGAAGWASAQTGGSSGSSGAAGTGNTGTNLGQPTQTTPPPGSPPSGGTVAPGINTGSPGMQPGSPIGGPAMAPFPDATGAQTPGGITPGVPGGVTPGTSGMGVTRPPAGTPGTGAGSGLPSAGGDAGLTGSGAVPGAVDPRTLPLEQRVRQSIMQGAPASGGIADFDVRSDANGRLILEGTVHSQAEKDNIQAKAAAFVGSGNVDNRINVK